MNKINRLKKYFLSAFILSVSSILLRSISVIFNIFLSNTIGTEGMGLITLTSGIYSFAITFATSGINFAVVRLVSGALPYKETDTHSKKGYILVSKIMRRAFFYCLFFSIIATISLFFFSKPIGIFLLNDTRVIPSLKIMAISLVPISISSVINGYFYAVRRVYKSVIVSFSEQAIKISVISSLLIFVFPAKISYAALAVALGGLIGELGSMFLNITFFTLDKIRHKSTKSEKIILWRNINKSNNISDISCPSVFGSAFPVAVSAYARSFLTTLEHLLIPWGLKRNGLLGTDALSSYGTLCGMVFPLIFFPSSVLGAFSSLLIPEIASSYQAKDFKRIKRIVSRVFGFSLIFSICISGVFISFSHEIGLYFFNSYEAGKFIKLLAPLIPIMYLDTSVDAILKGIGEHIYTMRINIIDSLLSVLFVFILIPQIGIYGYILTIYIAELFNAAFSIIWLLEKSDIKPDVIKWIVKPILSVILSTLLCRFVFDFIFSNFFALNKLSLTIEIFVCVIFYIVFSKILGSITKEETAFAKKLFN